MVTFFSSTTAERLSCAKMRFTEVKTTKLAAVANQSLTAERGEFCVKEDAKSEARSSQMYLKFKPKVPKRNLKPVPNQSHRLELLVAAHAALQIQAKEATSDHLRKRSKWHRSKWI
jgi:hypothetical protein